MAARPLPPPAPKPIPKETAPRKRPFLEMIQSFSNRPALKQSLQAISKKRWLRIAGIVVGVLFLLMLLLPLFINVNSFRPKIESEATSALGRQVKLGDLSLSILSGSVAVEEINIADDPAFSKSSFITAKSLKVGVELMPLIFSKQLNVTRIAVNDPQINLLKAANGKWNFSSMGGANRTQAPESQQAAATPRDFSVARLEI